MFQYSTYTLYPYRNRMWALTDMRTLPHIYRPGRDTVEATRFLLLQLKTRAQANALITARLQHVIISKSGCNLSIANQHPSASKKMSRFSVKSLIACTHILNLSLCTWFSASYIDILYLFSFCIYSNCEKSFMSLFVYHCLGYHNPMYAVMLPRVQRGLYCHLCCFV